MFEINEKKLSQTIASKIFPMDRTDTFFTSLLGDSNDGAYDIKLIYIDSSDKKLNFEFQLKRRKGKCLNCSITHGLHQVFMKHPVINIKEIVKNISETINITPEKWKLGRTIQKNKDLHVIPLTIEAEKN